VLTSGAIMIAVLGFNAFDEKMVSDALARLSVGVDRIVQVNPSQWYSIVPPWRIENGANMYALFGAVVITFLMKGLLLGLSGPEQLYDFQKFLATRNTREASLAGLLWGICHTVRFPMAMAIAIMGLMAVAGSTGAGFDAEKVLPYVIAHKLPPVLKGVALAALISAFMATFGAMVNGSASYLIRDIYQRYINPSASPTHYVRASYFASVLMIIIGIGISLLGASINTMITWILGFLGSAVLIPNVLRWYWWRVTGYGFAAGMWTGMALSLVQTFMDKTIATHMGWGDAIPVYYAIPALAVASATVCVLVTLMTSPPDMQTLANFYRTTQPTGRWRPVIQHVEQTTPDFRKEPFAPELVSLVVSLLWLGAMYVGPSYLVARQWLPAGICAIIVAIGSIILAKTWYRRLPK
jgi:solute:Na+ symporter, SSS family